LTIGSNVTVGDTSNSGIVTAMVDNSTDGAWLPQPYAALVLSEAKAHVFLDERSLWPGGNFSSAEFAVSTSYLNGHSDVAQKLVDANVQTIQWINSHLSQAGVLMNATIYAQSTIGLTSTELTNSLSSLSFEYDPLASSVNQQVQNAYELGFLGSSAPNLTGLINDTYLNVALSGMGLTTVSS
jgi:NitT/TauT family transport system substrate-binding protein